MLKENLRFYRHQAKITQTQLAEAIQVGLSTIIRWESPTKKDQPRASDIKNLARVLGISEAELLNGPTDEGYMVTLKYVKTLEGVVEEMMTSGMSLTVSDDGFIGVSGRAKFESPDDIDKALAKIRTFMEEGLESRERVMKKLNG
jgi:transcriptional regulator with XRE-family HTH domain